MLWIFALSLATGVFSADDCLCSYPDQPPNGWDSNNWPKFFIQNPFDSSSSPCVKNCVFFLDSGSSSLGIGNYAVANWQSDGGANKIYIYNCNSDRTPDTSNPLLFSGTFDNPLAATFQSSGQYVCVYLNMTTPAQILTTLVRTSQAKPPPTPSTKPPPGPPTTSYPGTFSKNPSLISLDVLFMVDGGANGDSKGGAFNDTKILASTIVDSFNPSAVYAANATISPAFGSRMTLRYLTSINYQNIGTPWNEPPSFISAQIKNLFQIQNTNTTYATALQNLLSDPNNSPFSINNSPEYGYQNSRPTAQRTLIIVASSVPSDIATLANDDTSNYFKKLDVHPIFISYGLSDNDNNLIKKYLIQPLWGFMNVSDLSNLETTMKQFFDGYLLTADNVCFIDTTVSQSPITYPANYAKVSNPTLENHQKGRYCNFHDVTYIINPPTDKNVIQFTVSYELEAGKDFLNFYQANAMSGWDEVASFSGADIGPSSFYTNGITKIQFFTNESGVFGGFNITYVPLDAFPSQMSQIRQTRLFL